MNITNITKLFDKKYMNNKFVIYPLITKQSDLFGNYDIPFETFKKIKNTLNKKINYSNITKKIYKFNNMELIDTYESQNVTHQRIPLEYLINNYIYQDIIDKILINIVDVRNIDPYCFPVVNKYHQEIIQNIYEYELEYIKLYLIEEEKKYYFYFSFVYDEKKDKNILNDLNTISKIINSL